MENFLEGLLHRARSRGFLSENLLKGFGQRGFSEGCGDV